MDLQTFVPWIQVSDSPAVLYVPICAHTHWLHIYIHIRIHRHRNVDLDIYVCGCGGCMSCEFKVQIAASMKTPSLRSSIKFFEA